MKVTIKDERDNHSKYEVGNIIRDSYNSALYLITYNARAEQFPYSMVNLETGNTEISYKSLEVMQKENIKAKDQLVSDIEIKGVIRRH